MGSSVKDYKLPVQPNVMNNNHLTASVGEAFCGLLLQSSWGAALSEKPREGLFFSLNMADNKLLLELPKVQILRNY